MTTDNSEIPFSPVSSAGEIPVADHLAVSGGAELSGDSGDARHPFRAEPV